MADLVEASVALTSGQDYWILAPADAFHYAHRNEERRLFVPCKFVSFHKNGHRLGQDMRRVYTEGMATGKGTDVFKVRTIIAYWNGGKGARSKVSGVCAG